MRWPVQPIHVMDFEGHPRYGIVEVGVVTLAAGEITGTWTRLCAPDAPMEPDDVRVHGIRENAAREAASIREEWERFVRMRRNGLFGAHHAAVEDRLLTQIWARPPAVPDFAGGSVSQWGPWLDTRRIYEQLFPQLESYALEALVETFGLPGRLRDLADEHCPPARRKAHCALYDALASALLLLELETYAELAGLGLIDWLQFSRPSAAGRHDLAQGKLW